MSKKNPVHPFYKTNPTNILSDIKISGTEEHQYSSFIPYKYLKLIQLNPSKDLAKQTHLEQSESKCSKHRPTERLLNTYQVNILSYLYADCLTCI